MGETYDFFDEFVQPIISSLYHLPHAIFDIGDALPYNQHHIFLHLRGVKTQTQHFIQFSKMYGHLLIFYSQFFEFLYTGGVSRYYMAFVCILQCSNIDQFICDHFLKIDFFIFVDLNFDVLETFYGFQGSLVL